MILRRIYPGIPEHAAPLELDLNDAAARASLLELYRPPSAPWLRLNFVASVSGSAAGDDGTSETLTSRTDRRILGAIRELSEVVLVGAGSVRKEGYQRPASTRLAVVTTSGNLAGHSLRGATEPRSANEPRSATEPLIVACPTAAVERVLVSLSDVDVDIIELPTRGGRLDPSEVISALRSRGFESIVCEGGPNLAAQLVVAGLVDELALSSSPVLNGGALPILGAAAFAQIPTTLAQLLIDESSGLYARWLLS